MNVQEIKQLFAYNSWATNKVFDNLLELPREKYFEDLKGSFGGIHGTLTHLVGAEKIWLSRWIGKPEPTLLKADEVSSLADLRAIWEKVGRETALFLAPFNEKKLQENITVTTSKGNRYTSSFQQMFQHVVNHSSYHRGQIAAMLRQVGAKPVDTDLIVFFRQVGMKHEA